jgi:cysteinyl-tRNA synthetase
LLAREKARASGHYDLADELREALLNVGINVNDSPGGATWSLNS